MIFCLMTLKRWLSLEEKSFKLYYNAITRTLYRRSYNGILPAAYHIKRHRKHSKRFMTVCAELTNLIQSSEINSENLGILAEDDP